MIKAVYFDYGGVLAVGGRNGDFPRGVIRFMELELERIEVEDLLHDLKRGRMEDDTFILTVNDRYPEAKTKLTHDLWSEMKFVLEIDKRSLDLAKRCKAAGLTVGILSNVYPASAKLIADNGCYEGFDPLVLSCDEGYAKPDPEFYEIAERKLTGVNADEILLIDDQDKCINGARGRGWQAVKVENVEQMVRDVEELLGLSGSI